MQKATIRATLMMLGILVFVVATVGTFLGYLNEGDAPDWALGVGAIGGGLFIGAWYWDTTSADDAGD